MGSEVLKVEKRGSVDWVTLNRPERLNALDDTLVDACSPISMISIRTSRSASWSCAGRAPPIARDSI